MATYLLTWSPKRWHWWDEISDVFRQRNGGFLGEWSSGNTKRIVPGDRVFLIRLGKEPRGIVGAGHAMSTVYKGRHWDKRRARSGDTALLVRIRLDVLRNPGREAVYPLADLKRGVLGSMNWEPPSSGVEIPAPLTVRLEEEWSKFVGRGAVPAPHAVAAALEGLRTETVTYSRGRSRMLRDLALARSRGICEACLVDFSALLDGMGVRALQAHHRQQLAISDKPRLTRLHEIAVVCATCHALIHAHPKKAMPVARLRQILQPLRGVGRLPTRLAVAVSAPLPLR